jgi:hypothetical protein
VDANSLIPDKDAHNHDVDHEDEVEVAYGDVLPNPI